MLAALALDIDLQTLALLLIAVMNMVTLYYSRRTEKNTNSMKDALVEATAKLSHAEGKEEGRKLEEESAEKRADSTAALGAQPSIPVKIVDPTPVPVEIVVKESPKEK